MAATEGHLAAVDALLKAGTSVAPEDPGNTAIHFASAVGAGRGYAIVERLINHGASVNTIDDEDGWHPIHVAAQFQHAKTVELLISNGASVSATDKHGQQPMHLAASQGATEVVQVLASHGAKVSAKDQAGRPPSQHASEGGHMAVVELLAKLAKGSGSKSKGSSVPSYRNTGASAPAYRQTGASPPTTPRPEAAARAPRPGSSKSKKGYLAWLWMCWAGLLAGIPCILLIQYLIAATKAKKTGEPAEPEDQERKAKKGKKKN